MKLRDTLLRQAHEAVICARLAVNPRDTAWWLNECANLRRAYVRVGRSTYATRGR